MKSPSQPAVPRRALRTIGGMLFALALVIALFAAFFDWYWLRGPLARTITERTGRELVINGDLKVKLRWPLTRIHVERVTFANP